MILKLLRRATVNASRRRSFVTLLNLVNQIAVARKGVLAVLTYHRIDYASQTPHLCPSLISTPPEEFAEQLDFLCEFGHVVSMQQVLDATRGNVQLPARSVLITFDDATRDFERYALPELTSRNLPATLFVPTGFIERPEHEFWWDRLHRVVWQDRDLSLKTECGNFPLGSSVERMKAFKTLRNFIKARPHDEAMSFVDELCRRYSISLEQNNVMRWDQLRRLPAQQVCLAPHTQSHPLLTQISNEQVTKEVIGSQDDLKREIGEVLPVFAYPGGAHDASIAKLLRQQGIELAFTVERGVNNLGATDFLRLKRINVGQQTTKQILLAQLLAGWCLCR